MSIQCNQMSVMDISQTNVWHINLKARLTEWLSLEEIKDCQGYCTLDTMCSLISSNFFIFTFYFYFFRFWWWFCFVNRIACLYVSNCYWWIEHGGPYCVWNVLCLKCYVTECTVNLPFVNTFINVSIFIWGPLTLPLNGLFPVAIWTFNVRLGQ